MSNIAILTSHDCQAAAQRVKDAGGSLEEQFRASCKAARDGWLAPSEQDQLLAAVAGLSVIQDEVTKQKILDEARDIGRANALLQAIVSGVPVDFDQVETPDPDKPKLGLGRIFAEVIRGEPKP